MAVVTALVNELLIRSESCLSWLRNPKCEIVKNRSAKSVINTFFPVEKRSFSERIKQWFQPSVGIYIISTNHPNSKFWVFLK